MAPAGAGPENQAALHLRACGWSGPAAPGADAQRSGARPRPAERGVQAFGRLPRCCRRLRRVLLRLAQLADRPGQPDEARRRWSAVGVVPGLAAACHGEEPGGGAEPVSLRGPVRDLPVGEARSNVSAARRSAGSRTTRAVAWNAAAAAQAVSAAAVGSPPALRRI